MNLPEEIIKTRPLFLDFEFNRVSHEKVNLVSCVTHDMVTGKTLRFWLHNSKKKQAVLAAHLKKYSTIVGYACVAEARSFLSLGLNPLDFKWIDLFLEYRMLTNHNDRLNWGKQLVDGKVKHFTKPKPKWERTEEDEKNGFKPTHSLAEATYKLTGEIRDTKEKDEVRALIISDPETFEVEEAKRILKYNADDVEFLPTILESVCREYTELLAEVDWTEYLEEALWRGRYSAHTAIMESRGYPINLEATKNFSAQIPSIMSACQRDINSQFKGMFKTCDGKTDPKELVPFKWNKRTATFSWNQKLTRQWLEENVDIRRWKKTDKGQLSLALDAFEREFNFKHDYPEGNFGAQIVRFLKLRQSLYGFNMKGGSTKKSFWDSVGPDGRVRPYMNIYGAQSGRSQPAATGFMFLKPAWMRALVEPAKGKYLAGIDYGQQEFFVAGLISGDERMVKAYLSGDPYLYMGKEAGVIPKDGTRKEYSFERDLMKSTVLGILFGMTEYGLSAKLTSDFGKEFSKEDALELVHIFETTYPTYIEWRREQLASYEQGYCISTMDGWKLWCDNDNPRSVLNVPVQGAGASIMRKAVDLAVERGCKVIFTLHDAIYIEGEIGKEKDILLLNNAMRDGFAHFFKGTKFEEVSKKIKLDPKAWGRDYKGKQEIKVGEITVPVSELYIDGRALAEYEKFSNFFSEPDSEIL